MKITTYGLGAIGSNLIIQLVKQFPDFDYVGVDFDKIEERNLRTQAFFIEQVGMPKALAIPVLGSRYVRKFKYTPILKKIETTQVFKAGDLYIDCFDNSASRKLLCGLGDVLHVGFSPMYTAEIIWGEKYDVPGDVDSRQGDICSMGDAVSFINFVVNFTVLTISDYINKGEKNNYIITNKTKIIKL